MTKIVTYNVNGIRSALNKDWLTWLKAVNADVVCLQEVKAQENDIDITVFKALGYDVFWYAAQKKGYSGVAILSKLKPKHVEKGINIKKYDDEGRWLMLEFEKFCIASVYMPSGSSGEDRQAFKMNWLTDFEKFIRNNSANRPPLIICGDYNICHKPIDIHNPVSNKNSSGFLPEERAWFDGFINLGFTDTFRHFNPEPHQYTWWSYRFNARAKNLGWRIDYILTHKNLDVLLSNAKILSEAKHSDHCPVLLEIKN